MGLIFNDGHKPKQQILLQPSIGLDSDVRYPVAEILNITLANEAVLAQKTRSALWNVHGAGFDDRHDLFDLQSKQMNTISEGIAERVQVLGGLPVGSFGEFIKYTRLTEQPGDVPDMMDLLADHEIAIRSLRKDARKCSEEYEDEVTCAFMIGILCLHEKMAWRLRSNFEPELPSDRSQGRLCEWRNDDLPPLQAGNR